jgi:transposase-like protein
VEAVCRGWGFLVAVGFRFFLEICVSCGRGFFVAGSPVKRQRRAEAERVSGGRAGASDPATRAWALRRAEVAGDEVAAREVGVNRATIRSWRARAAKGGGAAVSGGGSAGGAVVSAVAPVVVDGDELAGAEAELVEVRAARAAALTRSTELARAGNDVAASNAARAARDFATAARALAGEVVVLREAGVRLTEAQGEEIAGALQGFVERLELPWTGAVRQLLSECLRLAAGKEVPDIDRAAGLAARELHKHYAGLLAAEAPAPDTRIDTEAAPAKVRADRRPTSSGGGICSGPLGVEPKPAPLAHVRGETRADQVEGGPSVSPGVEIADHELVALAEIPVAWRSRFVFGADGGYRARVAWTRKVRADEAARAAAAVLAAEAEAEGVRVAAEVRAARPVGPAPAGWDSRRGGRGRGPSGERAGP